MASIKMDQKLFEELTAGQMPVLVDFSAPWCGYCRRIDPAYERLADQYEGRVLVAKVNIDDEVIRFLNLHYLSDDSFEIMIRYGFRKIMRYLDNNGITKNINEYFDYIEACHNLNFRMTKEFLYPENLRVAHDEVM
jgi:thiol-disulfide isomerase/thioredoxin